jgi:hypothetical protein
MKHDSEFTVQSARRAAAEDRLDDWVTQFLASPGSDNPVLAEKLSGELGWWVGPLRLPLDRLNRLAGPPGDPVLCPVDEEFWDDRVNDMDQLAEQGWEPPPVVVAYRAGQFFLEDGNHRVESVRQAGREAIWAVIGFTDQEERDRFTARGANPSRGAS